MQSNGSNLGWRRHQDACGDYTTSELSTNDDSDDLEFQNKYLEERRTEAYCRIGLSRMCFSTRHF
jgi:hypothetical protein